MFALLCVAIIPRRVLLIDDIQTGLGIAGEARGAVAITILVASELKCQSVGLLTIGREEWIVRDVT
jgi:hypothetical protein